MMFKQMLTVRTSLADGSKRQYCYEKIGEAPVRQYMAEKQKQCRKRGRLENGRIIFKEVPECTIQEIREAMKHGKSISALSRDYGLSWYLVKQCKQN